MKSVCVFAVWRDGGGSVGGMRSGWVGGMRSAELSRASGQGLVVVVAGGDSVGEVSPQTMILN